jgi:hypothetical protein
LDFDMGSEAVERKRDVTLSKSRCVVDLRLQKKAHEPVYNRFDGTAKQLPGYP